MVNEGFLDFFKKSHPPKVGTPTPVATKPSEPKVDTPKRNVYADQFVKIFDKLNEMATKNGFKESKRYIEQESGLDSFVNYVVFSKGSRDIRFDYYWDKKRVVGNFGIEVTDSGVDEYKTPQEVSQKEIPTVAKKLFSTKTKNDVVQDNSQKGESFEKYLNRTIDFEKVKQYSTKNGWSTKFVDDKIVEFEKGGDKIVVTIPSVSKLSKKLVSNIEYKGEQYEVLLKNVKLFLATIISGKDVPTQLALSEPNVSFIAPNIQTEPTPEKEPKPRIKPSQKPTTQPQETQSTQKQVSDSTIQKRIRKYRTELVDTIKQADDWDIKNTPKGVSFTRDNENIIFNPKLKNSKNEFEYVIYKNNRRMKFNSADELYKTVFKLLLSQPK